MQINTNRARTAAHRVTLHTKLWVPGALALLCLLLNTQMLLGQLNTNSSTATMKVYGAVVEKLTVYTDVPGHTNSVINGYSSRAKSDVYEIRVRSAATFSAAAGSNEWVQCFANMTYNRGLEMPLMTNFQTATASHAYQKFTAGWTHTYANIEMSTNSPVEVEIRKIGSTQLNSSNVIFKSAVHPAHKVASYSNHLGRVYFTITNPCQVVIDINGQMDDHNAAYPSGTPGGAMLGNPPVHSVAFYANPIMAKPVASPTNTILIVNPSQSTPTTRLTQPDPATYNTLVFGPGIHNIGPNFKVHPGKSYYLPGDAILYGNIGNGGVDQAGFRCSGDRINIYGYGTLCGVQVPHYQNQTSDDTTNGIPNPEYPEWNAWTGAKDQGVGIEISSAWDVKITGVTTVDPANFNTKFDGFSGRVNDQSLVSWVKLHSWRVNGDGFGGYSKVEDSFFRTSDDSTYVRDWRRRCTFWKDSNANIFRFVNSKAGGVEDCDIIYARWRDPNGVGSVFEFADGAGAQPQVLDLNLALRNIRFHDKFSNPRHLFDMATIESYRGLVFENISAYEPKNGKKSLLLGSELAPWHELLMFKNVTYKTSAQSQYDTGTLLTATNFGTYFEINEFVDYILFDDPRALTVALTADPAKGVITKNPNQATHLETTLVTLTATALPGYIFTGWVGINQDDPTTNSTANPFTIRMLENRSITANFGAASIADPIFITTPSTGSWVVPSGASNASFYAWGAGGAGGSAYNGDTGSANTQARGGGGAGGGYASATLAVTPGQVIHYTNGAGGVAAADGFAHNSYGATGGVSVVRLNGTTIVSARGGPGGQNISVANANFSGSSGIAPTSGNTGATVFYGGNGASANSTGSGGGGGSAGALGDGGDAPSPTGGGIAGLGGGAAGGAGYNSTALGNAGGAPGAGGSGAAVRTTAYTHQTGGQGGDGKIIFTYNNLPVFFTLSTTAVNGTITLDPPGGTYLTGTTVGLAAVPASGYTFSGWSGAASGTNNPTTVLMNSNQSVTANFTPPDSVPWVVNFNGLATGTTNQGWPTTWTATRGGTFRVAADRLEINGAGGEGVFTTGVINISGGAVNVSVGVQGVGGLDSGDYVRFYIKTNGGVERLIRQVIGAQAATTWTTNGITGTNLQIVIRASVSAIDEFYYLDNIIVANISPISPSVTITQPSSNAVFAAGANLLITANASDPDGTVAKVEYFIAGTTKIGQSTSGPTFGFTWTNVPAGKHSLTAKATDYVGATGVSSVIPITVRTLLQSSPQPGGQIQIQWAGGGTLQTATNVQGLWCDVSGAISPYLRPTTNSAQFFRVRQ